MLIDIDANSELFTSPQPRAPAKARPGRMNSERTAVAPAKRQPAPRWPSMKASAQYVDGGSPRWTSCAGMDLRIPELGGA